MKTATFIFGLVLALSTVAMADQNSCSPSPAPAKKIVRVKKKKAAAAPVQKCEPKVVEVIHETRTETRVEVQVQAPVRKNRIKLLGGYGPTGIDLSNSATHVQVESKFGPVIGIGYSRLVTERVSIEANVLSNSTGLLGVGYDF